MKPQYNFDFSGATERKQKEKKAHNFKKFMKMGFGVLAIVVVLNGAGMGYTAYRENVIKKENAIISVKEHAINNGKVGNLLAHIEKEKSVAGEQYTKNQILLSKYGQNPEVVKLLNLQRNLAQHMSGNMKAQQDVKTLLDKDRAKLVELEKVAAPGVSRDNKVEIFLERDHFKTFEQWSGALDKKQFMYVGGLINLNKDISRELEQIESTKAEVMTKVKERIKAKDFNLDEAQGKFLGQLASEKNKELNELAEIKNSLQGTEAEKEFTSKDLQEANSQLAQLEGETEKQIKKDRETIESLIASIDKPEVKIEQKAEQKSEQVAASSNNFATYMLMYHWMSMSSNNAAYQAGVHSALTRTNPYNINTGVTSSRFQQMRSQMMTRANTARATISRSGFGRSGAMSAGG